MSNRVITPTALLKAALDGDAGVNELANDGGQSMAANAMCWLPWHLQQDGGLAVKLSDLQDGRRVAKTWLPQSDQDVTNGLVVLGPEGKPRCVRHGAMNRVDPYRRIYRCSEFRCGVGGELVND